MYFHMQLGHATNCIDAGVHTYKKVFTETAPPFFVPTVSFVDILLNFRNNYEVSVHNDFGPCV